MALIGTIRKNFWFVLILLGLALAAFILMDMQSAGNAGGAVTSLTMAEVDGEPIDYGAFQRTEQNYYSNSGQDVFTKRQTIWDFYVEEALLNKEAEALGFNVSVDELMDLQFGANPSPIISANWRNPQTGQLNLGTLNQVRQNIENNEPMDPRFRSYWAEQEKQIIKETLQNKLNTLISKSVYTPSFMAEESYAIENSKVDFNYVKIPYDQIDGEDINVSDADFHAYLNENAAEFETTEETRTLDFAVFNVVPTSEDSSDIRGRMETLNTEFAITNNDSLFVTSNNGSYSHLYGKETDLPEDLREGIKGLSNGEILGPVVSNGFYLSVKLIDKKVIPDSVQARHILVRADRGNAVAVSNARAQIDSIERVYKRGRVSFDTLAVRHSADPQSAAVGGDLGTFPQEMMVPEFTKACFVNGKSGGLYQVQTQFGIHLIEVQKQIFNDNELKYHVGSIGLPIKPTQDTQDERYDEVAEIVTQARDMESLKSSIESLSDVNLETVEGLTINDHNVGSLGSSQSSREIVKWGFDTSTEVGDVSPEVYRFTDPVNYYDNKYVIVGLSAIQKPGLPSVESVRSQIETAVINRKKGEKLQSSLNITSLQDVADQYDSKVEQAIEVAKNNRFIPGMGYEPEVVGAAFRIPAQSVSQAIIGESGVYLVSPLSHQEAGAASNLPFLKTSLATTTRSQVNFKIIENLKNRSKVKDERYKFF